VRWIITLFTTVTLAAAAFGVSAIIVKQVALTNQTVFIPTTQLLTPSRTALYRISAFLEVTSLTTQEDTYFLHIGWTDAPRKELRKVITIETYTGATSPPSGWTTMVVSDLAGTPITYSVTNFAGGLPEVPFNLYMTVEQLQ
jgi:hypothetical protein